ncbi:MAG: alpha/beta hydrolase fold domain-containing protein [Bryobacteraceae bacterium]
MRLLPTFALPLALAAADHKFQCDAALDRINAAIYQPGDRLLLRSGCVWNGTLRPQGSGAPGRPIVIDRYGEGAAPVIHGGGAEAALLLHNQEFWEVRNLELTNDAGAEGLRRGVLVRAENTGRALRDIKLSGLHVHHVKGKLGADTVSKTTGGIAVEVRGKERPSRFDGLTIENCRVEHVDNTGIYLWSDFTTHPRDPRWRELRFTGVTVRGNALLDIGKNAMGIRASLAPLIERNVVRNAAARLHGNAIYVFGCKDALLQYNEVSGTKYSGLEGAAYDSDYNSEGTIIQFNQSIGNGGGLVNLCNNPRSPAPRGYNEGTIVRRNFSRNETDRVIGFDGPVTNALIEDNTLHIGPGLSPRIVEFDTFGKAPGYADRVTFRRNLIVNEGSGTYVWGGATNVVFANNAMYGKQPNNAPPSGDFEFRPAVPFARELKADLYLPAGAGPFPAVLYIHGGGWSGGDRSQLRRQAAHMAARGVAGVAIDYRLSGQARYPAALEDCREAVRWIRANASAYRIDGSRLAAAGSSAGGHLAALLALAAGEQEKLSAVVALNPVLDLTGGGAMIERFLGASCREKPELCREASPLYRVHPGAPPFLIGHGTADKTVPYSQAAATTQELKAAGVPVELFTAESGPHTFWNNPRYSAQIMAAMERFLLQHLR